MIDHRPREFDDQQLALLRDLRKLVEGELAAPAVRV
jgi:hypothetical protein